MHSGDAEHEFNRAPGIAENVIQTIKATGPGSVCCLQGSMIGRKDENGPLGSGLNDDVCFTLNTIDRHAVVYQDSVGALCNCDHKGVGNQYVSQDKCIVEYDQARYTVRRLTPTECLKLQDFPNWWFDDLAIENPTEDELLFWEEVWETHRKIIGKPAKPKTRSRIIKWLKKPYSDSAAYKAVGNSLTCSVAEFVLYGIVEELEGRTE